MSLIAKTVVKNKFWIVEEDGIKVATIQKSPGGVAFVKDANRELFPSIKNLGSTHNIIFDKIEKKKKTLEKKEHVSEINGYPTNTTPYNVLHNVQNNSYIYTKKPKSKSYFCAGYYIVQFSVTWVRGFCPKLITLERYKFKGPFKTKTEMQAVLQKTVNEPDID